MKRLVFLMLLLVAEGARADSAWQASAPGPGIINLGMQLASPPLTSPEPVSGEMTTIVWRYRLNGPAPADFRVYLCSTSRCTEIEGARGSTRALYHINAAEPLHFVYGVPGTGRLNRKVQVVSNEVMVNYRPAP
ncbi:MAG: Flagellar protein FlhE [Candidatus Erwinia impunctatus]|nr:Flagellar protein FlhE [Culicoides impunctatus]